MIIVRIAEGAWQHAGARFSEWVGTAGLIGWGLMLFNEPDIFAKSPSFSVMARWADQAAWANILLAAGAFRFLALVLNGTLPSFRRHTPTIRFLASWLAFMTWGAVALGMFAAWRDVGGLPTGWVAYGLIIAPHEWRNILMTRRDMAAVRRGANAMAGK